MQRYLGIDVHRDSSTICVLDATGKQVRQGVVETHGEVLDWYSRCVVNRRPNGLIDTFSGR